MFAAVSVIIIIILASITPLLAFPTFRIAFEGVLIKLTGFLFGPLTGVITGAVTEFLVTILRPSYVHWGYSLAIILYGLFGGIAYYVKSQKLYMSIISNVVMFVIIFIFLGVGLYFIVTFNGNIPIVKSLGIVVPKWFAATMFGSLSLLTMLFILFIPFYLKRRGFKNEIGEILPILLLAVLTEYFVAITIIPYADEKTLGLPFLVAFVPRIFLAPFEILGNTFVIYTIYKLLGPIFDSSQRYKMGKQSASIWFSRKSFKNYKINRLVNENLFQRTSSTNKMDSCQKLKVLIKKYQLEFDRKKVITIAGTNGKSGLVYWLENLFIKHSKLRVGSFISPHLFSWNERIKVNGLQIPSFTFFKYYQKIESTIEEYDLTFFEIFTLISLMYFKDEKVDYIIMEIGIGASKDAANALDHYYGVVTSIGLDHQKMLGNTLEQIAIEKAHVTPSAGKLFYVSDQTNLQNIFNDFAKKSSSEVVHVDEFLQNITISEPGVTKFEYKKNQYQLCLPNYSYASLAALFIEVASNLKLFSHDEIKEVLANDAPPLRTQIIPKSKISVVYDGAHNVDAINNLMKSLSPLVNDKKVLIIFSSLKDKDYKAMLNALQLWHHDLYLTTFESKKVFNLNEFPNYKKKQKLY